MYFLFPFMPVHPFAMLRETPQEPFVFRFWVSQLISRKVWQFWTWGFLGFFSLGILFLFAQPCLIYQRTWVWEIHNTTHRSAYQQCGFLFFLWTSLKNRDGTSGWKSRKSPPSPFVSIDKSVSWRPGMMEYAQKLQCTQVSPVSKSLLIAAAVIVPGIHGGAAPRHAHDILNAFINGDALTLGSPASSWRNISRRNGVNKNLAACIAVRGMNY